MQLDKPKRLALWTFGHEHFLLVLISKMPISFSNTFTLSFFRQSIRMFLREERRLPQTSVITLIVATCVLGLRLVHKCVPIVYSGLPRAVDRRLHRRLHEPDLQGQQPLLPRPAQQRQPQLHHREHAAPHRQGSPPRLQLRHARGAHSLFHLFILELIGSLELGNVWVFVQLIHTENFGYSQTGVSDNRLQGQFFCPKKDLLNEKFSH